MQAWVASHVTWLMWTHETALGRRMKNGSAFFLFLGDRVFAVTAAHVYRGYLESKRLGRIVECNLGNLPFDPELRLVGLGADVDIATFSISPDDLSNIRKQALVVDPSEWPPPHPFTGQGAYIAGFPFGVRLWSGATDISMGLYIASPVIGTASDTTITCPFDRRFWVPAPLGTGIPPEGFDMGGISGGPLLVPMDLDGAWYLHLGGVISEAPSTRGYETVICEPAHYISAEGMIYDRRSAPLRHATLAT